MQKKKGRRPNSYYENLKNQDNSNKNFIDNINTINNISDNQDISKNLPKKRGRKPKGGKIVENKNIIINDKIIPNIILHLNCKLLDLHSEQNNYNPTIISIKNYNIDNTNKLLFEYIDNKEVLDSSFEYYNICDNIDNKAKDYNDNIYKSNNYSDSLNKINDNKILDKTNLNKNLSNKIKELSKKFKSENSICKSACFWCTCDFDNDAVLIPKYELKGDIHGYGHFCSPECAVSYLMNEHIDSTSKFERYYLLNNLYGNINNYSENIKLAPNPFYTLDKYYGNLSIQEYRQLLKSERLLVVLEKPLSKLLPEVYEENNENILTNKIVTKNNFKIKQKNC
tara:strand:+ start:321 stop:1337 length:1017 start_codon:yes stop_codon:yes gene_type:complete